MLPLEKRGFLTGRLDKLSDYTGAERINGLITGGFVNLYLFNNGLTGSSRTAVMHSHHFADGNMTTGGKPVRVPAAQLISDPKRDRTVMGSWLRGVVAVSGPCIT